MRHKTGEKTPIVPRMWMARYARDAKKPDDAPRLTLGRRQLMALGGTVVAAALGPPLAAQRGEGGRAASDAASRPSGIRPHTQVGWINDADRASGNGPMDETTKQIVDYVMSFSDAVLNDAVVHTVNRTMVDTMACLISGFESEPARICAKLARMYKCDLKSTMMGYGI